MACCRNRFLKASQIALASPQRGGFFSREELTQGQSVQNGSELFEELALLLYFGFAEITCPKVFTAKTHWLWGTH